MNMATREGTDFTTSNPYLHLLPGLLPETDINECQDHDNCTPPVAPLPEAIVAPGASTPSDPSECPDHDNCTPPASRVDDRAA
jgi:hypothetical protein